MGPPVIKDIDGGRPSLAPGFGEGWGDQSDGPWVPCVSALEQWPYVLSALTALLEHLQSSCQNSIVLVHSSADVRVRA
jgi:hypothetical protein